MSLDTVSRANRAALSAAKALGDIEPLDEIIIGRDVLELVSSAMYIDPMTVYREYIQNAADAVDEARRQKLIAADAAGQVEITVDAASRSVRIRDNGSGISNSQFARRMAALGGSGKRGTTARGFRGVGRLVSLGYAQELIFRSKTADDAMVAELIWDCRKLKAALREDEGDLQSLIRNVTTLRKKPIGDYPARFFEVELRGILRIRSDKLMSPAAIEDYLGQVAPVPFAPEFRFGENIRSALAPFVALGELNITIDGSERPVYRPHRDVIVKEGTKPIAFDDVSITTIPSMDGEPAAIVWILHHQYDGALSNSAACQRSKAAFRQYSGRRAQSSRRPVSRTTIQRLDCWRNPRDRPKDHPEWQARPFRAERSLQQSHQSYHSAGARNRPYLQDKLDPAQFASRGRTSAAEHRANNRRSGPGGNWRERANTATGRS